MLIFILNHLSYKLHYNILKKKENLTFFWSHINLEEEKKGEI